MWRPDGWENHYAFMTGGAIPTYENQYQAFEAGADVMLEMLIRGKHLYFQEKSRNWGYLVFIPDKEDTNVGH